MTTKYLRDVDVAARYGTSRPTVWRWTAAGRFPKPVKLSPGCTRWRLADIEQWEKERGASQ